MLVYSSLTILIFCTDKLIKYFIDKTAPDWSLKNYFLRSGLPMLRTTANHWGVRSDCIETGVPGPWVFKLTTPPWNTSGSKSRRMGAPGMGLLLPGSLWLVWHCIGRSAAPHRMKTLHGKVEESSLGSGEEAKMQWKTFSLWKTSAGICNEWSLSFQA